MKKLMEVKVAKYRKKPVIVEAFQMTKERRTKIDDWPMWLQQAWQRGTCKGGIWPSHNDPEKRLVCGTPEGYLKIDWGDWIIKGAKEEIHLCKDKIFRETYEIVE